MDQEISIVDSDEYEKNKINKMLDYVSGMLNEADEMLPRHDSLSTGIRKVIEAVRILSEGLRK